MRTTIAKFTAAATLVAVIGATSVAMVFGEDSVPDRQPAAPTNSEPGPGERSVKARTMTRRGEVGVLVYRNKAGQRCITAGRPNGDGNRVGSPASSSFNEAPLGEVGLCNLRLAPVAFQILHSREEVTLFGLAADDIESVQLTAGDITRSVRPAADDAFLVSIPNSVAGTVTVRTRSADGTTQTIPTSLPDLDELSEGARRNAPPLKPGG